MFSRIIDRSRAAARADGAGPPAPGVRADSAERFHRCLIGLGDLIFRHRWTPLFVVLITIVVHILLREVIFPRFDPLEVGVRACAAHGEWFDLVAADATDQSRVIKAVSDRPMVLLGKTETGDLDEGRWLSFTVAALYGVHRHIVLAVDAFAPAQQPILDRWVKGEMCEATLLRELDWQHARTPDPETYLPLLRLARLYRLPLVAVGVGSGAAGEQAVEQDPARAPTRPGERSRGPDMAPLPEGYRRSLAALYLAERLSHDRATDRAAGPTAGPSAVPSETAEARRLIFSEELTPILISADFNRFTEERRIEDYLIARNLLATMQRSGRPLVVAAIGRDRIEFGWGVPAQLAALGIDDAALLLPFAGSSDCALVRPGIADAVFILEPGSLASSTAALPLRDPANGRHGGMAAPRPTAP